MTININVSSLPLQFQNIFFLPPLVYFQMFHGVFGLLLLSLVKHSFG